MNKMLKNLEKLILLIYQII